jgi:ABC-type Fe3+/spermidine/putrescine transport system ATPase subunit
MLEVRGIFKAYDGKLLLDDISFTVAEGETVCLLGASGSGKSTLLRIIAGLESLDAGLIAFNGLDLTNIPPHLRDFGLVFQDYALFPHLNVNENVAFGLKMRHIGQDEINQRVGTSLELVNLAEFGNRKVTDLSGGEQQRVALARALAIHPQLLMFDEPLGALDRALREDLLNELRAILHRTKIPAIYVTHDQEEAFTIADRVLILHHGEIIRAGTPAEVWANPQSAFVARFLGSGNLLDAEVVAQNQFQTAYGIFTVTCAHKHSKGDKVHLLARPLPVDGIRVERSVLRLRTEQQPLHPPLRTKTSFGAERSRNAIHGTVADVIFQQDRFKVTLENGLYLYLQTAPQVGEKISARVKVECLA